MALCRGNCFVLFLRKEHIVDDPSFCGALQAGDFGLSINRTARSSVLQARTRNQQCRPKGRAQSQRYKKVGFGALQYPNPSLFCNFEVTAVRVLTNSPAKSLPTRPSPAAPPSTSSTAADSSVTIHERSIQRYIENNPLEAARDKAGLNGLSAPDRTAWIHAAVARSTHLRARLPAKLQKELWKHINDASLDSRVLKKPEPDQWGPDRNGQPLGAYPVAQFEARRVRQITLSVKEAESLRFKAFRSRAQRGVRDLKTGETVAVTQTELEAEKTRRGEIAALKKELYGEMASAYGQDPVWDDVVPILADEPEGALAAISYPAQYAEGRVFTFNASNTELY